MFYFLAQATTDLTQNDVTIWTALMEGAAKWGLGIALSILMFVVFFFLIRKVMSNFDTARTLANEQADKERATHAADAKEERELFIKLLDQKDLTINNHLDHLTAALTELKDSQIKMNELVTRCQEVYSRDYKENSEKIVEAIRNQTDLFIRLFGDVKKENNK